MTGNLPAIPGQSFELHHAEILSAVEAAMKSVGVATQLMIGDNNPQRFTEAKRMVTIGQALSRMRGRLTRRVGDVGPRRRRGGYAQFACGPRDMEGNFEDDPYDEEEGGMGGVVGENPLPHIGAPRFGGGDDILGEVVGTLGPLVEQIASITSSRDKSSDRSQLRLDRTRELESLIRCRDQLPENEKAPIQKRIDIVTQAIAAPDPEPESKPKEEDQEDDYDHPEAHDTKAVEKPERRVHCVCGNSHGEHWVTAAGTPRDCDICGHSMSFDPEQPPSEPHPQPQAAQGVQ